MSITCQIKRGRWRCRLFSARARPNRESFSYDVSRLVQRHCPFWIVQNINNLLFLQNIFCVPSIYFIHHRPVASNQCQRVSMSRYTCVLRVIQEDKFSLFFFSIFYINFEAKSREFLSKLEIEINSVHSNWFSMPRKLFKRIKYRDYFIFARAWHRNFFFVTWRARDPPDYLNAFDREYNSASFFFPPTSTLLAFFRFTCIAYLLVNDRGFFLVGVCFGGRSTATTCTWTVARVPGQFAPPNALHPCSLSFLNSKGDMEFVVNNQLMVDRRVIK